MFPQLLTRDAAIYFTGFPCNFIYTRDQLRDAFLAWFYPVTKKLNQEYRVYNFMELHGELVCSFWDRFTSYVRGVSYHRIDDESLKAYFYLVQDDKKSST